MSSGLPFTRNFDAVQECTWSRNFVYKINAVGVNLSNYTADFSIWNEAGKLLLKITSGNGITLSSTGQISVELTADQVSGLKIGSHNHLLRLVQPNGKPLGFVRGRFNVVRAEVTP